MNNNTKVGMLFAFLTSLVIFCSCSKELEMGERLDSETETVNGISVTWKKGVTEKQRELVREFLNDMVYVEGGIFPMGSNNIYDADAGVNEMPMHYVKLTDYYILAHEITPEQVAQIRSKDFNKYDHYSFYDWETTIKLLSSYSNVKFSFPTEAQWEYAALGGQKSQGYAYPGARTQKEVWTDSQTAPGCSLPNELGLYNMGDLNGEWCQDIYGDYSDGVIPTNPCNYAQSSVNEERVVRGGCYLSTKNYTDKERNSSSFYHYEVNGFSSSGKYCDRDYRMCRSKSRAYAYADISNSLVSCRPVINIQ